MFLTLSLSAGNHCQVALNLVQHLTKSRAYETLKRVQGDTLGLFTRPSNYIQLCNLDIGYYLIIGAWSLVIFKMDICLS